MEIVQERLEREFSLDLIASAPSVEYEVELLHGRGTVHVDNPSKLPPVNDIVEIREPWVRLSVVTPGDVHRGAHGALDEPPRQRSSTSSTSTRRGS